MTLKMSSERKLFVCGCKLTNYSGNYSTVQLGINKKTTEEHALKIVHKDSLQDLDRDNIMLEIELMRTYCAHPHILQLKDVFEDRKRIILVLEL
jgi:NUAK family SNF1-like kinase